MKIIVTGIEIGGCPVPVPPGLSELMSRVNAWEPRSEQDKVDGYESMTYQKNGKWFTKITPTSLMKGERHESINQNSER